MRRAFFTLRVPNPIYWLSLRARWRGIVIQAALKHIAAVNARAKKDILADDTPVPFATIEYGGGRSA